MKNPSTPSSPPATSGEEVGPPPSPLKLGKESERIKKPPPQMFKTATASSSPPPATEWSHDVFLSFIGKDSWKFTDQLCTALVQKGIITFRDDGELEMGISIVPEMGISIVPEMGISIVPKLFEAIEQSRCVIVILSTNYASSTCCLEDLAKAVESMKETGKKVFPVFYDVHPAEVRNQTGYFGEAFSKHEQSFKDDMERVRKWRAALTEVAQIAGWDLLHGHEINVIRDIVENIVERVCSEFDSTVLSDSNGLSGMESRVEQMLSCLDMSRSLDVRVLGICGMGGIGKTTIAQVVFERISSQFDACSFLANVREVTGRRGLVHLQKKFLSDTMPQSNANIHEIDMGIEIIKRCLCTKRVLIILDDVDQLEQLKALCGHDWFGPGSRIIITTRDAYLLDAYGVDKIYNVSALTDAEALQLFIRNCFKNVQVEEGFLQLSKHILKYASGLPLAIEVLNSFLSGRNLEEWFAALDRLNIPEDLGSTSGVSETTSCDSLIKLLPLSHRIEEILESYKGRRAKEAEWVSSELYSPIEQVQRTREEEQKDISISDNVSILKSQKWREIAELVPSELHSPIKQVQRERKEDEMETSNVKENVVIEEDKSSPEHLQGLFLFCFLFPSDFEFRKHELVQLWIAEGLNMKESEGETMEDAGIRHFNSLERKGFFVRSRRDIKVGFDSVFSVPMYSPRNFFYKVNPVELSVLENRSSHAEYFKAVNGKLDGASESTTQHLSFIYDDIDEMTFGIVPKFKNLRTLLLLSGRGSSIKRVPGDLFLSLNFLTTLKLSQTLISGLPSSVGDVKPLRYLDVSYTPIRLLPESIGSLANLQTLKLIGCKQLSVLPRSVQRLTALRHLDFDIIGQLNFMPAHLGNLTDLQTLSAFLVNKDDGRGIQELKNLNDLGGALRILRLENVLSKADAEVADLPRKKRLQRLDLRWTSLLVENIKLQEEILDSLRPHSGLKELQILFYNGTKLPAWLSRPSFTGLVVMTLYKCENCELLTSIGQLPKLKFLSIVEMNKVKAIDGTFFRSTDDQVDESFHAFPKLEVLEVDIMLNLREWKEVKEGDLPSLINLTMESCPELVTLPSFSGLKCLKYLEVRHCRKLLSFDRNKLPTSLESLIIRDCPKLKEWCDKEGDQDLGQLKSCGQSLV